MKNPACILILFLFISAAVLANPPAPVQDGEIPQDSEDTAKHTIIFAAFAETEEQKYHTQVLAESIRAFAGAYRDAPIWIYMPENLAGTDPEIRDKLKNLRVKVKTSSAPAAALKFYFARKVFAAAAAEAESEGKARILAWMDEDTAVLREPRQFLLGEAVQFGYRPVMHRLIGSGHAEPPDPFWTRVYEKLSVPKAALFPMTTPGDLAVIRPYFNAGLLVVRPERGILRKWASSFPLLYEDPVLVEMCNRDVRKRVFLHQAALAGAVLGLLEREEMVELPSTVNYPLFFHEKFDAKARFDSIEKCVTIRYDVYFRDPAPNWWVNLKGPKDKVAWLKDRLGSAD